MASNTASDIAERVDGMLLKLLDGIEKLIEEGRLSPLDAYETLCRAEAIRTGNAPGPLGG